MQNTQYSHIRPQRWGFWMTLLWFGVWALTTQVVLSLGLLSGYLSWLHLPLNEHNLRMLARQTDVLVVMVMVVNLLSLPLIGLMVVSKKGSVWRDYMAWRRVAWWRVLLWVVLCMVVVVVMGVLYHQLGARESDLMSDIGHARYPLAVTASVALVAPLVEEMVFRGFVYGGFERSIGRWSALWLSSLIFALMHAGQYNLPEVMQVLVLGLMLGLARMRTGSIWTSTAMHMVNNGVAVWMATGAVQLGNG